MSLFLSWLLAPMVVRGWVVLVVPAGMGRPDDAAVRTD
jgi:hypothetical protein